MQSRLLYLDHHHMDEVPFLQRLARLLVEQPGAPSLIVHGSGGYAKQALEGKGLFRERQNGVLQVEDQEEVDLVDRAMRQYNKKLVALLTEEGVPAVGLTGASRNLLQRDSSGEIEAHRTDWLAKLIEEGTVPVVAALVYEPKQKRIREVHAARVAAVLAKQLDSEVVFFSKNDEPGLLEGEDVRASASFDVLQNEDVLVEPEAVRIIAENRVAGTVTNTQGLKQGGVTGTKVEGN